MKGVDASRSKARSLAPPLGRALTFLAILLGLLTALVAGERFVSGRAQAGARLEAVVAARQAALREWLEGQARVARYLTATAAPPRGRAVDPPAGDSDSDSDAYAALLARAVHMRQAVGADLALLVDADGIGRADGEAPERAADDVLRQTTQRAIASGETTRSPVYRRPSEPPTLRIDVVVPLRDAPSARGGIVLRIDAQRALAPLLGSGSPLATDIASTLWQRVADRIEPLVASPSRPARAGAGSGAEALAASPEFAARLVREQESMVLNLQEPFVERQARRGRIERRQIRDDAA